MTNALVLGMVMLASSTAVSPPAETSRAPGLPAAFTFDLPGGPPGFSNRPSRFLNDAARPVWRRATWQSAQSTTARRFSTTDRIIAVAAGVCLGWITGGAIGYYATADHDNPDDDTSGLKGVIIGAPIGAAVGGILGYKLTSR